MGEKISPLLFALYVNSLENLLCNKNGPAVEPSDSDLACYLKHSVIMYADGTVLVSDTPEGLQLTLNSLCKYCMIWKLKINKSKTKVLIFSKGC